MDEVVVGIDFGSSGSGFAYAFGDNIDEINIGHIYGANADNKVPTEIIIDDNNNAVFFGNDCLDYIKKKGINAGHYFKEIKMNLYEKKTEIQAKNSEKILPLTLVIQRVLEKLKELAIAEIKKNRPSEQNNIKYVVTVPAIWEESQKNIMMDASIKAGLIKEEDDKSLFFALEPEAASYYCSNNKSIEIKEGDYYIICDLGGGTGDIVTHLIGANKNVNEIYPPNGGKFGSNEINKLFLEDVIFKIFDCKDFSTYYRKYLEVNTNKEKEDIEDEVTLYNTWLELERNINDFKEGTKNNNINIQNVDDLNDVGYYPINLELFKDIYNDEINKKKLINNLVEKYNKSVKKDELKIKIKSSNKWIIVFPHKIIYYYIKEQVKSICELINKILDYEKRINSIILVGGYISNEVLVSEIKNQLSNKIPNFIQPPKPQLSIMEGAVLFGLNPNKIIQRKARYTIGMKSNDIWEEELHSKNGEKYYDKDNKVWRCKDCFSKFITKNQNLKLGQEIINNYTFLDKRYCTMNFYKTDKSDPIFIFEEGIQQIGKLRFDLGKDYPPGERAYTVTMRIGGTFIDVKCKHKKSGKAIKTILDFN